MGIPIIDSRSQEEFVDATSHFQKTTRRCLPEVRLANESEPLVPCPNRCEGFGFIAYCGHSADIIAELGIVASYHHHNQARTGLRGGRLSHR